MSVRRRRLRSQLTLALVATALVSLLMVGTINFFAARALLQDGAEAQLVDVAEGRVHSIERGLDRLLARGSTTAADRGVVDALVDFEDAFAALDEQPLSAVQEEELDAFYASEVIEPLASIGIDVALEDIEPGTAGRFVQYHYVVPNATGDAAALPDDSRYRTAIDRHDDFFTGLVDEGGIDDILLISPSGDVVYTAAKNVDIGTNLIDGPLSDTALSESARNELPRARLGDAVASDLEIYLPGGGRPALFVLAAVTDGSSVVGAIGLRVSVDALNAVTTAGGDWERAGLGDGESYVVDADGTLLSESRRWLEDPDGYLEQVDDPDLARLIEVFGSPVGLQQVDTRPVRSALDGDVFVGPATNYLGDDTFAYAREAIIDGLDWVVVAEQPEGELRAPLWSYVRRLGVVMLVLLPIAGLLGVVMARRLTRAIVPVVAMAEAVTAGERELQPVDLGSNEVGDLARQLERMARQLGAQERALEAEFEERRELLRSVLPPRLVARTGEVDGTGEAIDDGTVIAVMVQVGADIGDEDETATLGQLGATIEELAADLDIERIRTAADRFLFVAGVGRPDDGAARAVDFVDRLVAHVHALDVEHQIGDVSVRAGLATGAVATGVLERGSLTFGVWGEPVRRALAIAALSTSDEILVDESTAASLGASDRLRDAVDVVALDGEAMALSSLSVQPVASGRSSGVVVEADADDLDSSASTI